MKPFIILLAILAGIVLLAWIGLKVKPQPFSQYPYRTPKIDTIPLPAGLPKPVDRFYRMVYGENIPIIKTVVLTGTASMRPVMAGPRLQARFVFVHNAGKDYRHYFEATFFNLPILKVNEGIIEGKSFFESPMGSTHNDPNTNQGANLAVWAEGAMFPSIFLTDSRAHWQAVDDNTALLYVPYENQEENFVVRFNPQTGLIDSMEAMRYRSAGDTNKILWITRNVPGKNIPGSILAGSGSATWLDQGTPWATFTVEDIVYNADVSQFIQEKGYTPD